MNVRIKFRESFRPFAPAVLRERRASVVVRLPEARTRRALHAFGRSGARAPPQVPVDADALLQVMEHDPDLRRRVSITFGPRSRR